MSPPELLGATPARVLAVYAHPDDPDMSCGGTLARWAGEGAEVRVAVCTTGDKGTSDPSVEPAALVRRRAAEMDASARILGLAGQHRLGRPDGELAGDRSLVPEIVALVRRWRPELVVCPDPEAAFFGQDYFNHRDHRSVGWDSLDAVAPAAALPHYFPDAGPPHQVRTVLLSGTLCADVWVDVTPTIDVKADAVLCHQSQLGETSEWLRTVVRQRAEEGGRLAGVAFAEGFRRLRLAP